MDADKKPQASVALLAALLQGQPDMQQVACAKDRDYLNSLIDGTGDLLAEDTFTSMEPMFAKYESHATMMELLTRAAEVYADAALWAAAWVVAGSFIEEAQRRAQGAQEDE